MLFAEMAAIVDWADDTRCIRRALLAADAKKMKGTVAIFRDLVRTGETGEGRHHARRGPFLSSQRSDPVEFFKAEAGSWVRDRRTTR